MALATLGATFGATSGGAQRPAPGERAVATAAMATRAALSAALASAEQRGDRTTAAAIRRRLSEGDLGPGDRLTVTLTLDTISYLQLVVRDSQRVEVPALGALSLRGVLRSELPQAFRQFFLRYYRNPDVRVESLIRVGFLGAVQKAGYYSVPPDAPVAEAFLANAGGLAGNGDPKRIEIKRGSQRLYDRKGYERIARDGLTFGEAGIQSNDELRVGERKNRNIGQIVQNTLLALSAFTTLVFLIRTANN